MNAAGLSLRQLYQRYGRELRDYARRRVGRDGSDDVVHDAYLRLASYGDVAALDNPRAYLYRVTANAASDFGRRFGARARDAPDDALQGEDHVATPTPGPEVHIEQIDLLQRCSDALDHLPLPVRQVFLLHRVDGIPQTEISATLGIPLRTVERYVARALARCLEVAAQ